MDTSWETVEATEWLEALEASFPFAVDDGEAKVALEAVVAVADKELAGEVGLIGLSIWSAISVERCTL